MNADKANKEPVIRPGAWGILGGDLMQLNAIKRFVADVERRASVNPYNRQDPFESAMREVISELEKAYERK